MPPTLTLSPAALLPNLSPPSSPDMLLIPQFNFYPGALDLAENKIHDKSASLTNDELETLANRFQKRHNKNEKRRRQKRSLNNKSIQKVEKIQDSEEDLIEITPGSHFIRKLELYGANGYNLEMKNTGIVKAERRNTKFGKCHKSD